MKSYSIQVQVFINDIVLILNTDQLENKQTILSNCNQLTFKQKIDFKTDLKVVTIKLELKHFSFNKVQQNWTLTWVAYLQPVPDIGV